MQEKIIFDGRLEARPRDVWEIVDGFLQKNLISPLDSSPKFKIGYENQGDKKILVIYPPPAGDTPKDKIINGYVEVRQISLLEESPVDIQIVSCRPELDLLYFQLSQIIQAKFIIPSFPPDVLVTSWRDLMAEGWISPTKTRIEDIIEELPDPDSIVKKYGTDRDLTANDVRRYVKQCRDFQKGGGTVKVYHESFGENPKFSLDTLQSWLKDPKFAPVE